MKQQVRWHRALVGLAYGERTRYVRGYACEGLAVHRARDNRGTEWRVTLEQSRLSVGGTYSRYGEARQVAERLLGLEGFWLRPLAEVVSVSQEDLRVVNRALSAMGQEPRSEPWVPSAKVITRARELEMIG